MEAWGSVTLTRRLSRWSIVELQTVWGNFPLFLILVYVLVTCFLYCIIAYRLYLCIDDTGLWLQVYYTDIYIQSNPHVYTRIVT